MFRLAKVLSRGIPSIQTMRIAKRNVLAMTIHITPMRKESENVNRTYTNNNGESVSNWFFHFILTSSFVFLYSTAYATNG